MKTTVPTKAHSQIRLSLMRLAWVLIVALYGGAVVLGLPEQIRQYGTLTGGALRMGGVSAWSGPGLRAALEALGLSSQFLAFYRTFFELLTTSLFVALGGLVFLRRGNDRLGWFVSLFLVTFGLGFNNSINALAEIYPDAAGWFGFLIGLPWFMFYLFFFIYPDGQFVPRWTAYWAVALFGLITLFSFAPDALDKVPGFIPASAIFGLAVYAPVYRYRRISDATQRAQVKWMMYAIAAVAALEAVGQGLLPVIFPALAAEGPPRLIFGLVMVALTLVFGMLPLALTLAILRYRLWDIDLVIRRTLQYSLLSGLLAVVYFGGVIVLQSLFTTLTGAESPIALVASTLAIAALFLPLRRRVQAFIDKRFYRQKYDAQKVLAEFAATCRDETDLDKLTTRLVEVMQETMQPDGVIVWLKDASHNAKHVLSVAEGPHRREEEAK